MPAAWAVLVWLGALLFLGSVAATPGGRRAIAAAVADAAGWIMQAIVYVAPTVALSMAASLVTAFEQNRDLWARVVGIFLEELTGGQIGPQQLAAVQQGGPMGAAAGVIFQPLIEGITHVIAPEHQLTPEDGLRSLDAALARGRAPTLQAWWTEAGGGMISLAQFAAACELPAALGRGGSINPLGRPGSSGRELAREARTLYGAGRLTQPQLEDILASAHYSIDEIQVILAAEDLKRAVGTQLTVTEELAAYRDQLIDGPDLRERLRTRGYDDADIDLLIAMQHRQLSPSNVVDALIRGQLTPEEATAKLTGLGYSQADAQVLLSLRTKRLSEGQVLDALRRGLINIQQATDDLGKLGWDPDQVQLFLAFQARRLDPAMIQAAVARGLMSPEEALQKLVALGYSQADAELIVDLRRRLLTVGQVLDAYGDGLLTRPETLGDLQARGFSADDALALVTVFELKQAPAAPAGAPPPSGGAPSGRRRRRGGAGSASTPPTPTPPAGP